MPVQGGTVLTADSIFSDHSFQPPRSSNECLTANTVDALSQRSEPLAPSLMDPLTDYAEKISLSANDSLATSMLSELVTCDESNGSSRVTLNSELVPDAGYVQLSSADGPIETASNLLPLPLQGAEETHARNTTPDNYADIMAAKYYHAPVSETAEPSSPHLNAALVVSSSPPSSSPSQIFTSSPFPLSQTSQASGDLEAEKSSPSFSQCSNNFHNQNEYPERERESGSSCIPSSLGKSPVSMTVESTLSQTGVLDALVLNRVGTSTQEEEETPVFSSDAEDSGLPALGRPSITCSQIPLLGPSLTSSYLPRAASPLASSSSLVPLRSSQFVLEIPDSSQIAADFDSLPDMLPTSSPLPSSSPVSQPSSSPPMDAERTEGFQPNTLSAQETEMVAAVQNSLMALVSVATPSAHGLPSSHSGTKRKRDSEEGAVGSASPMHEKDLNFHDPHGAAVASSPGKRGNFDVQTHFKKPELPNPKRLTVASQKVEQKKLARPFRPPALKRPRQDLTVTKNPYEQDCTPTTDVEKPKLAIQGPTTHSSPLTSKICVDTRKRHRTQQAAAQFKSPLTAETSSKVLSSVRLTPTIQALERRLQNLRRAVKVKRDGEQEILESLVRKWTEAGQEVAQEVWELVKESGSNEEGGWGTPRNKGVNESFDRDRGSDNKAGEQERNWGWNFVPNAAEHRLDDTKETNDAEPLNWDEERKDTLGTMLIQLGIGPETLRWNEDEGAFERE